MFLIINYLPLHMYLSSKPILHFASCILSFCIVGQFTPLGTLRCSTHIDHYQSFLSCECTFLKNYILSRVVPPISCLLVYGATMLYLSHLLCHSTVVLTHSIFLSSSFHLFLFSFRTSSCIVEAAGL